MISALFIRFSFGEFEAKDQREGEREFVLVLVRKI